MNYVDLSMNKERAFLHLLIYATLMDGLFKADEAKELEKHVTDIGMFESFVLKDEIDIMLSYKGTITSRYDYLSFLVQHMNAQFPAGILLHLFELAISDNEYTPEEEITYSMLSTLLGISELHQDIIKDAAAAKRLIKLKKKP